MYEPTKIKANTWYPFSEAPKSGARLLICGKIKTEERWVYLETYWVPPIDEAYQDQLTGDDMECYKTGWWVGAGARAGVEFEYFMIPRSPDDATDVMEGI